MKRRAFLGTLASGLLAAPLAAETQQAGKVRPYRVGVLHPAFGETTPALTGLRAGLKAAAMEEGRDVVFEIRFTRGEVRKEGDPSTGPSGGNGPRCILNLPAHGARVLFVEPPVSW